MKKIAAPVIVVMALAIGFGSGQAQQPRSPYCVQTNWPPCVFPWFESDSIEVIPPFTIDEEERSRYPFLQ